MDDFNPFLPPPSPYRPQNQSYASPPQNFYGGSSQTPGYTSARPSDISPDAWMQSSSTSAHPSHGRPDPWMQPGYPSPYPSYGGSDAWMQPGYTSHQLPPYSGGHTPALTPAPVLPPAQAPCSGPPNRNLRNCQWQHVAKTGGGAIVGAWAGVQAGWKCPATWLPVCVCVGGVSMAVAGGVEGYASAIDSASCQDVTLNGRGGTCTNTDPAHMHLRNHVER